MTTKAPEQNEDTKTPKTTKAPAAEAEFEYPEYTGVVATVRKKDPGTYETLRGGLIRHEKPKKLMSEAEVEQYSANGFLEVRYTNEYLSHKENRQAAELAFLKKKK